MTIFCKSFDFLYSSASPSKGSYARIKRLLFNLECTLEHEMKIQKSIGSGHTPNTMHAAAKTQCWLRIFTSDGPRMLKIGNELPHSAARRR
mmetsp:Transcript_25375/g.39726  ORF Transcript_25375/g.39726 Transcript_25375/m.39726 type:complete len:91 (-) Transcript_25375:287-559(-)